MHNVKRGLLTDLSHWKGKPIIALEDWIQIRGQLSSRLEYFPDDFDQTLTYIELPYYRYEFEGKKRMLEAKRLHNRSRILTFSKRKLDSVISYCKIRFYLKHIFKYISIKFFNQK